MNPQALDLIQTVTYLLPIAGLIWKASSMASEIKTLRKDLDTAYKKACDNNLRTNERIEQEQRATDTAISTIIAQLSDIKVSLARLDERLSNVKDKKQSKEVQ